MACNRKHNSGCPFAETHESEIAQGYGCLPTPHDIITMRVKHGKTWACHDNLLVPCAGGVQYLKEQGLPYKVIDKELVTERSNWDLYTK